MQHATRILATATAAAVLLNAATSQASIQWRIEDGGNGHWYEVTANGMAWDKAEAQAVSMGGHLASITNQAEQDFINNTFLRDINGYAQVIYWIGLTDEVQEGDFRWVTSEALSYTNWNPGEPNNSHFDENYAAINWHYTWYVRWGNPNADLAWGKWNDVRYLVVTMLEMLITSTQVSWNSRPIPSPPPPRSPA